METAALRRRAVRGGAILVVTRSVLQAMSWFVTVLVARYLRPFDYGVLTAGGVVLEFADRIAELGITRALVRKPELTDDDLAEALSLTLLFSVAAYGLVYAAAVPAAAYFQNEDVVRYLRVSALILFLVPFRAVPLARLEHQMMMGRLSALQGVMGAFQSISVLALAIAGFGYWALVVGVFASRLGEVALLFWTLRWRPRFKSPWGRGGHLIRFGLHSTGSNLLHTLYSSCDFIIVGRLAGPIVLGYYTLAVNLVTLPVTKLTVNANQIIYPVLSRLQGDPERMRNWYLRFVGILGLVGLPVMTGLALVAGDAVPLLLGEKWRPAVAPLQIMAVAGNVMVIVNSLTPVFNVINRPDINLKYTLACSAFLPPAYYLLGRSGGATGVAIAWAVVFPLIAAGFVSATRHLTGFGLRDFFRVLAPTLSALALMIVVVFGVGWALGGSPPAKRLTAEIVAGAVVFALAAYSFGRDTVIADLRTLLAELRTHEPGRERDKMPMSPSKSALRFPTLGSLLPYRWWWRPGRERDAVFYDRQVRATHKQTAPRAYANSPYYFLWAIIVDRLRSAGFGRVLEIGCGSGHLAEFLFDQGMQHYVGLDFSASALERARHVAPRGTFILADARTTTAYDDFGYDVIICTEVLEHIEADLQLVSRFAAGKRCLCSVPNFDFESHVRYFRDTSEVEARYGKFFDSFEVVTLESAQHRGDQFFLFDGIRNDYVAEA